MQFFKNTKKRQLFTFHFFLRHRRPWPKLGFFLSLLDFVVLIACQCLIISGAYLFQGSSLRAMEGEENSTCKRPLNFLGEVEPVRKKRKFFHPLSAASVTSFPNNFMLCGSFYSEEAASSPKAFYKDAEHPLTGDFWKKQDLSKRLKHLKHYVDKMQEKLINNYNVNAITIDKFFFEFFQGNFILRGR